MIQISQEQMAAFEEQVVPILKSEYVKKLKGMYPERTAELGSQKVRSMVNEGFAEAETLEIEPGNDVFRLIQLKFLPSMDLQSPAIQNAVSTVLGNTNRSGEKRLDFIYKHIVPLSANDLPASTALKTPVLEPA